MKPSSSSDKAQASQSEILASVAQQLGTDPDELMSMVEAIERGESRAEYFGFTDEVLRSIETIALAYYRGQRYTEAQSVFGLLIAVTDGQFGSAWRGMGACALAQRRYPEAIQAFRHALAQNRDDAHSAVYLGESLCLSGERNAGLDVLRAVLDRATKPWPKDAHHLQRAQAILTAGGLAQEAPAAAAAAPTQQAADKAAPHDPEADIEQWAEATAQDILESLTAQRQVADPQVQALLDNPETRPLLDELAQAVRDNRTTLRHVADFSQEQMDAGYALACQLLERGEPLKAAQAAAWMLHIDGHDTRFHRLVGLCMHHLKLWFMADYFYTLVGIWRPGGADAATLMYHGETKIMLDEREEGLQMLQRGIALAGSDVTLKEVTKRGQTLLKQLEKRPG